MADFALPKLPVQCCAGQGSVTMGLQKITISPSPFDAILCTLSYRKAFPILLPQCWAPLHPCGAATLYRIHSHCPHPPPLLDPCQRAKKGSSCCQTQRWTETSPDQWKVVGKVTHTEPQTGNTCVIGSLCWILWICSSEVTQWHMCTI